MATFWKLRAAGLRVTRGGIRLVSALVLLTFVVCHLVAHSVLIVSMEQAGAVLHVLMWPWHTEIGTATLVSAFLLHYGNALWSIYVRRYLRLSAWEWSQLLLGLCIPPLFMMHVIGTRFAEEVMGALTSYKSVLLAQWVVAPSLGVVQVLLILTVWLHASIGIHFWLRTKDWYPRWRPAFAAFALLLPTLALSGFVTAGNQIRREAADPQSAQALLNESYMMPRTQAWIRRLAITGWSLHLALVLLPFAARGVRRMAFRRKPPILTHANGRTMPILPGATVLETLRANRIAHASVCGGRGRCTTCRVRVAGGLANLPEPGATEARALEQIGATRGLRLACQIRPVADLTVTPLLPPDAVAADGGTRGGLEGTEREITVVFVDLRGFTALGEAKLPYDVLFILNRFFHEMTEALAATDGHYSQFTGDGLMALYGLHTIDPGAGARDALRGAREMLARLDILNRQLAAELPVRLRIGIGIHHSDAIVGTMGPPRSRIVSAIGDTVNTAARLEGLTKDYDCAIIISRCAAEAAGLDVAGLALHDVAIRGRVQTVEFYALTAAPALPDELIGDQPATARRSLTT